MRVLTWALDSWRTPAGKIIAMILSIALVFSCSNAFLYSAEAYADGAEELTEETMTGVGSTDSKLVDEVSSEVFETEVKDIEASADPKGAEAADETDAEASPAGLRESDSPDAPDGKVRAAEEKTRVYVYIKIAGDTDDWSINEKGWCTIGYIDVPASELAAPVKGATADESIVLPYLGQMVRHNDNKDMTIDFGAVAWGKDASTGNTGLHVTADGANGFGVKTAAWHLDGYLYIANQYSVHYTVEGLEGASADPSENTSINNKGTDGVTGSVAPEAPEGFAFLGWYKNGVLVSTEATLSAEDAKASLNYGIWNGTQRYLETTFVAKYAEKVSVSYAWTDAPQGVELPQGATLVSGDSYEVDTTDYASVPTYDDYGNVNGHYVFSGWDRTGEIVVTEDTVIEGTWAYEELAVATHEVTYDWENAPESVEGKLPQSATVVNGAKHVVDQVYTKGFAVDAYDAYGNVNGQYVFSGWDKSGEFVVTDDVKIVGTWDYKSIEPLTFTVDYAWSGDAPEGYLPPVDDNAYVLNQPYEVDTTYPAGFTVEAKDEDGAIIGKHVFEGWEFSDGIITGNLTIKGTWTYESVKTVSYEWAGLPEGETLYDEDGNEVTPARPEAITGLFEGDAYAIDSTMPGTTVYTQDAYGNKTAGYILGAWDDPRNGIMGEGDVVVSAIWTQTSIEVPSYVVSYIYEGRVPAGADLLPKDAAYAVNQPVEIAAEPAAIEGWEFIGWTLPAGIVAEEGSFSLNTRPENGIVVLTGTWKATGIDAIDVDAIDVVYDGNEHPLTVTGTLPADEVYFKVGNSRFDNDAVNVTDVAVTVQVVRNNVLIAELETTVRITPAPLSVEVIGNAAEVFYNSEVQAVEGYTYTVAGTEGPLDSLPEGVEIGRMGNAIAQGTNAGTYSMGLKGTSFWFTGENRGNYDIELTIIDGSLTIAPTPVMVIVGDATKVAGTADPTFTANVVPGPYNNEMSFTVVRPGAGVDEAVGTYEDAITVTYAENPNYAVTVFPGTLTITAAPVPTPAVPDGPAPVVPPAPVDGGATPAPADGGVVPADAGAATVAAIDDDATPLAEGEAIEDDATPLSAFDEPECWVHILMIIGIILTIVYGLAVVARRLGFTHEIDKMDKDLTASKRPARKPTHVRGTAHSA